MISEKLKKEILAQQKKTQECKNCLNNILKYVQVKTISK